MRTNSGTMPVSFYIEKVNDIDCDIVFATNVEEYEIETEGGETEKQYAYDMYRLRTVYSDTLADRVEEHYDSWLTKAESDELNAVAAEKVIEVRNGCQNSIYAGVDVETEYGTEHFSLDTHDQQNLSTIKMILAGGVQKYPYHADGKECVLYNAADLNKIIEAATAHVAYHTTYCNMLRTWIRREDDVNVLAGIYYGAELPEDLAEDMEELL